MTCTDEVAEGAVVAEVNSLNSKSSSMTDTEVAADISTDGFGAGTGTNDGCCIICDDCGGGCCC